MNDNERNEFVKQPADAHSPVSPALLSAIAAGLRPTLRPVKPLAPTWMLASALFLASAGAALVSAALAGLAGFLSLGPLRAATVCTALAILLGSAATELVHTIIPGSPRRIAPAYLIPAVVLALAALFAAEFHDYHTTSFVASGLACLIAGLQRSVPAGILTWLLMRRGFAVNPIAAGAVAGTVAGLSGVAFLELHCTNFQALHILVWHTAVLPAGALLGAAIGASAWRLSLLQARIQNRRTQRATPRV